MPPPRLKLRAKPAGGGAIVTEVVRTWTLWNMDESARARETRAGRCRKARAGSLPRGRQLNPRREKVRLLLERAHECEGVLWEHRRADYPTQLRDMVRSLVAGSRAVLWSVLDPKEGRTFSYYESKDDVSRLEFDMPFKDMEFSAVVNRSSVKVFPGKTCLEPVRATRGTVPQAAVAVTRHIHKPTIEQK